MAFSLFGNGDDAGLIPMGQKDFDPYKINDKVAQRSADGQRLMDTGQQQFNAVGNRQAPTMQAAKMEGTAQVGGQNIGAVERVNGANLGSAAQGTAAQGQLGTIRRDDLGARDVQMRQVNSLEQAANGQGPSLAGETGRAAQDRNAKQAAGMAASMRGQGNAALTQRLAMNNMATSNQQAALDAATMRTQEQIAARSQLTGALSDVRNQDIGVNTTQAQMNQQGNFQNAELAQNMNLANLNATNSFALQQAQLNQQANLANQGAYNQRQMEQAQLNYNQMAFNAGAENNRNILNAQMQQQSNQSNLQSNITTRGQNDQAQQFYYNSQVGQDQSDRNAAMQIEQMRVQQDVERMKLEQAAYESSAQRNASVSGGLIGAGLSMISSDENAKKGIKPLDGKDLDEVFKFGGWLNAPKKKSSDAMNLSAMPSDNKSMGVDTRDWKKAPTGQIGMNIMGPAEKANDWAMTQGTNPGQTALYNSGIIPSGQMSGNSGLTSNAMGLVGGDPQKQQAMGMASGQIGKMMPEYKPDSSIAMVQNSGAATSDERAKKDIVPISDEQAKKDLRKMPAYKYHYKDPSAPGAGEGEFISPMAQDMEKTEMMKNAVVTGPDGKKMVSYGHAMGNILAGMSMLNKRLDQMENKKGNK